MKGRFKLRRLTAAEVRRLRVPVGLLLLVLALVALYGVDETWDALFADHTLLTLDGLDPASAAHTELGAVVRAVEAIPALPGERISGMAFSVRGGQPVKVVIGRWRTGQRWYDSRQHLRDLVRLAAERHAQYEDVVFVVTLGDADLWFGAEPPEGFRGRVKPDRSFELASARGQAIATLLKDHANAYFVHWNPSVIDHTTGAIGPRTIPIPDFDFVCRDFTDMPPYAERKPSVAWRGTTTGEPAVPGGRYETSDRYRAVSALDRVKHADVKFSGIVQRRSVPYALIGASLTPQDLLAHRVQLDVDGNANSWDGLRWKLAAGAVVVKVDSHRFVQWYYPDLVAEKHLTVFTFRENNAHPEAALQLLVQLLADDTTRGERMSAAARAFATQHLGCDARVREMAAALDHGPDFYRIARDWRIGGGRRPVEPA
jgi:hypothetical protein